MGLEIRLQGKAFPCVAQEDIVAGRAIKLVPAANAPRILAGDPDPDPRLQGNIYNIVQGAAYPTSDNETAAKYVAAFRVYNEAPPYFIGLPTQNDSTVTVPYTLRQFPSTPNLPSAVTLDYIAPRLQETGTIASGALMLAYDEGIYTVSSGCYVAASFTVGSKISVKGTGGDKGKWYQGDTGPVGVVFEWNATTAKLTIKTEH